MSQLTQELLHALFEYQPDGRLLRKVTTNSRAKAGAYSGCPNKWGYLRTVVLGRMYTNHRLIWFMHHGTWPEAIDHINGDKQDNRIENLRECTQLENCYNQKIRKQNTTGVKGVGWRPDKKKFRARIIVNGTEICLGHFKTLEEAAVVVKEARIKHHGEFANHG
jgi:hypothetical protein